MLDCLIDIPEVTSSTPSHYIVTEGQMATLKCTLIDANPRTNITWKWFKTDSLTGILHNGPTFNISNIHRDKSGSYNCTAGNSVGISIAATIEVDVQCKYIYSILSPIEDFLDVL